LSTLAPPIAARDLWKRYDGEPVLRGLSLTVPEGTVYGLLGRNGAGKTTLLHLLLGFLRPDRGDVRVLARRPAGALDGIGYLPERVRFHDHFTPPEYLRALGEMSDLGGAALDARCREVVALVGLEADAGHRIGGFSKGMIQRLGIAQALLAEPQLVLIDEPTSGLDPAGQFEVLDLLDRVRASGQTILMCTHQIPEIERFCDVVGVLVGGAIAGEARVAGLPTSGARLLTRGELPPDVAADLTLFGATVAGREVRVDGDEVQQQAALRLVLDRGLSVAEFGPLAGGVREFYRGVIAAATGSEPGGPASLSMPSREAGGEGS
jgi:ABC-2 type transport system ATP-binding protein